MTLLENQKDLSEVVISISDVTEASQRLLERLAIEYGVKIRLQRTDPEQDLPDTGHISRMTFSKFDIWRAAEGGLLYIDADTVVLGSIQGLPENGEALAMVPHNSQVYPFFEESAPYAGDDRAKFNAGVIFFGRSESHDPLLLASKFEPLVWGDQDLFNLEFKNRIHELPGQLNANGFLFERAVRQDEQPMVLHFMGPWKPWHVPAGWRVECERVGCGFSHWFDAENRLLRHPGLASQIQQLRALRATFYREMSRPLQFWLLRATGASLVTRGLVTKFATRLGRSGFHPVHR